MNHTELYQTHLDRVSRSFALAISRLENPLKKWVGLTYLVCRILDTVEDAKWSQISRQHKSFDQFDKFISSDQALDLIPKWASDFPDDLPEGERLLIQDAKVILEDLHSSPNHVKRAIQELVRTMSAGMRHFAQQKSQGAMRLRGLREVNQYCFFVAGIVGETLSKLLNAADAKVKITRTLLLDAHHFGLFLQKVNLLKDQNGDEKEGRFLVPSREETFLSLQENAEGAMRYIEAVPLQQQGYRVFCLWSLFLGLKTLPMLKVQNPDGFENKIPRPEALAILNQIESFVAQKSLLRDIFQELIAKAYQGGKENTVGKSSGTIVSGEWISALYTGPLQDDDFKCLNMT